jgi:SAM-dependent methyltransferase
MKVIKQPRWELAQSSEAAYWQGLTVTELLRIAAEKPTFLELLQPTLLTEIFDGREILEIGVGPLGISLLSFYQHKNQIKHLTKVEPLPQRVLADCSVSQEQWASPLIQWLDALAQEGEYIQMAGENLAYENQFETVVIYNVLDHVQQPDLLLRRAYRALRSGGHILIGVDCRSLLGQLKFEHILRRTAKGTILVDAHPYSFLPSHITRMLIQCGFQNVVAYGLPGWSKKIFGSAFRPAFIAKKT